MVLLLLMVGDARRRGYRHLLDSFWDECASHGVPCRWTSPSRRRTSARRAARLRSQLLRRVLRGAGSKVDTAFRGASRWNDRRLFVVDGCKVNWRRGLELDASFGRPDGGHVPPPAVSVLVNVLTQVPCDVVIDSFGTCERQMLLAALDVLQAGDVLVLDRGYRSHQILRSPLDLLSRLPASPSLVANDDFRASGGGDYRVMMPPAKDARPGAEPLELRAIQRTTPKGEESCYFTTLRRSHITHAQIAELYRLRWQAEELGQLGQSV